MRSSSRVPIVAILLIVIASSLAASAEGRFSFESTPGKLPKTIVPRHYVLRLEPDMEKFTTRGKVEIELDVTKPVRQIVLNALDMEITRASLVHSDGESHASTPSTGDGAHQEGFRLEHKLDSVQQTLTLAVPGELEVAPGKYRLAIEFNGKITARAQGLYYVKYSSPQGRKVMLGTQMEATDARRMFPCWDEPVFRATFELTIVVPEKHMAISNMPMEKEQPVPNTTGLKEVKFMRTPPMASYLVALVSGELEELKGEADGVKIRVITTEGKRAQAKYALESAEKILAYYDKYFGVKFPLPKLDEIAVPGGFTGAMENWGAIIYNERALLFDPKTSSQETKRGVFGVIAHEMAHQWFGDLVTMAWWDNIWLNEGFASWMGTKATDHFNPEWDVYLIADANRTTVMSDDSRKTTHPIQQTVANESQANDAFDQITYRKGQAFLRMLENFLGEEPFRKGLHDYVSEHRFSNTTTADLWAALEQASGKPVTAIAAGWTEQPGLPVVKVKSDCVSGHEVVTLEQERFAVQDPDAKPLEWKIPIVWADIQRDAPAEQTRTLLESKSVSLTMPDCSGVFKANAGNAGYYRVAYEPALLAKLRKSALPIADRLNLLNDTWAMVEANRASATDYLDFVDSLRDEKSYVVWSQIFSGLDRIDGLEMAEAGRAGFRLYASALLRPQLQRLGWEPKASESSQDALLRTGVISRLGVYGDEGVIEEAKARFAKFLAKPDSLPAELRVPVLRIVGRYADRATYDQLHDLARKAKGTEERRLYYHSMAGALDPELAKSTLALSLTDETVPQETTHFVVEVAEFGEQRDLAWSFTKEHLPDLLGRLEAFRRNAYIPSILGTFSDTAHADELETYVKTNISEDALVKARETAEQIRLKAALKLRELPAIDRWVAARS
jgi:aminopeptidase N